jgi:hypothetical protein
MLRPRPLFVSLLGSLALLTLTALATGPVQGQAKSSGKDEEGRLPREGPEQLNRVYGKNREAQNTLRALYRGETAYDPTAHKEIVDAAAKYFAYRLTWEELHDTIYKDAVNEVEVILSYSASKPDAAGFRKEFFPKLATYLKDVLHNRTQIARTNAGFLLAKVAEHGPYADLADILADAVKDPKQTDGVKYWALKGLQKLFQTDVLKATKEKDRLTRTIQAVVEMVQRVPPKGETLKPEELEGLRVVRREAIAALAASRSPVMMDKDGKMVPGTPPVLALLRLMRHDGTTLEPRLDEQVEAAIGAARMPSKPAPDYQPEVAAYEIGRYVVELADRYQASKDTKDQFLPWKKYAGLLGEALEEMKQDTAKHPSGKYVTQVADRCKAVLTSIEKGASIIRSDDLGTWLNDHGPTQGATLLFKSDPTSTIKPSEPGGK